MKSFISSLVSALAVFFFCLLTWPAPSFAQVVQLAWNPSQNDNVAGYKIYYKAATSELPLDGVEALEGPSPIDVGNVNSFTLSELPEGAIYYFRASAYDSLGNESELSNLATSKWMPATLAPAMNETIGTSAVLVWSPPPNNLNLKYSLLFGTDPKLENNIKVIGKRNRIRKTARLNRRMQRKSNFRPTMLIKNLKDTTYTANQLLTETTYYWQVIATDANGQQYTSVISSFVTEVDYFSADTYNATNNYDLANVY